MLPRAPRQVHTIHRADTQTDTPGQLCTAWSAHSWPHACESTVAHPGRPSRRVRRAYRHRRRAPGAAPLRAHHRIAPGQQPQPRARARPRQDIKVAHHGAARAEARPSAPGAAAARPAAAARASKVSLGAWVWKALQRPAASAVGRGAQRQRVPRVRLRVRTAGQAERKRNMQPGTQGGCARPPPPLRGILMARVQKVPDSGCEFVASPWAAMLCCEANRGF